MVDFVRCPGCGAEMAPEDARCPVCGADAPAGKVPKKSAFAPSPAGTFAGTAPLIGADDRPRNGFGCFGVIMFVIGFATSFYAAVIFTLTAADRIYSNKIAQPVFSFAPTLFSMAAFIMVSSFAGAALFYNFSALVSAAEEYAGGRRNFIRALTFAFYYLVSFAIALPLGIFALIPTHGRFFITLICLSLFLTFAACLRITLTDLWPGEKN